MNQNPPTTALAKAYSAMYDHFNKKLFDNELPHVVLNFSRHAKFSGFFAPERWETAVGKGVAHEISLNPDAMQRPAIEVASTLVHEMVHLWQQEAGKPSRRGYHNTEWATKMAAVGLTPSSTGEPGGPQVGQRMTHYVTPDGRFAAVFAAMPTEYTLPWRGRSTGDAGKKVVRKQDPSKVKYTCPCENNVWGKTGLAIRCDECDESYEEV